jgi:hypothetical protein
MNRAVQAVSNLYASHPILLSVGLVSEADGGHIMYRFSGDQAGPDRFPGKQGQDNALSAVAGESTPKAKVVLLEIGIALGIALAASVVVNLILGPVPMT